MPFIQSPPDIIFRFREAGYPRLHAKNICKHAAINALHPRSKEVYQQAYELLIDPSDHDYPYKD